MNIQLESTVGYDLGIRTGKGNAIQALTTDAKAREVAILEGFAQLVNEAGFSGATVKDQLIEKRGSVSPPPTMPPDPQVVRRVDALAERLERLAGELEKEAARA